MATCEDVNPPVTSVNSLISTIKTDKQVRRWFAYLISQQAVKRDLSDNREASEAYKKIRNISFQERAIYLFLFCALLFMIITRQFKYSFLLAVPVLINIFLYVRKKECIIKICSFLISDGFHQSSFARLTLYQIGEFYSRKYSVISLVDAITSVDVVTRKAVLYTVVFASVIYPLNFWQTCGVVLAMYYIFYGLIGIDFIYEKTK